MAPNPGGAPVNLATEPTDRHLELYEIGSGGSRATKTLGTFTHEPLPGNIGAAHEELHLAKGR